MYELIQQTKAVEEETKNTPFDGVDELMEIDAEAKESLMQMETVKQKGKDNTTIEFDKIKVGDLGVKDQYRRIPVPRHRFTPLKQNWDSILKTLVEHMKL